MSAETASSLSQETKQNEETKPSFDAKSSVYNPFEYRDAPYATTDTETLIHLIKGCLGSGILAMPLAFANAGLWFGLLATFFIGIICTYCVHILVKCSQILCQKAQVPSLSYADVVEQAFLNGPVKLQKWSHTARVIVDAFLVADLLGSCAVYNVFVATNVKQVAEYFFDSTIDLRLYIFVLLFPLIPLNFIRSLKHLAPFSIVANSLIAIGLGITLYYTFNDLPSISDRPFFAELKTFPIFFGTVIFTLEAIAVVMSLENNMKNPSHMIGCPGVLNIGMTTATVTCALIGFMGYWKFGDNTKGSVTLNLPLDETPAQLVKLSNAIAMLLTHALAFHVQMKIVWARVHEKFSATNQNMAEYAIRATLVAFTVMIAIAIPILGPFVSLIGAVCLSTLGLIIPPIIETITYYNVPGFGRFNWILHKNILLIVFGVTGFLIGTCVSIQEIYDDL